MSSSHGRATAVAVMALVFALLSMLGALVNLLIGDFELAQTLAWFVVICSAVAGVIRWWTGEPIPWR